MRQILKCLPAILLIMPMAAQLPTAASPMSLMGKGQSGCLVYIGEPKGKLFEGLKEITETDELVEMDIAFAQVKATSPSFAKLASELKLSPSSLWALTDGKGRCLLQGDGPPSAKTLLDALVGAGAKSPIRTLRDFLRQRPDHLDARAQLLDLLRKIADSRTRRALQITAKAETEAKTEPGDAEDDEGNRSRPWPQRARIDTDALEGKKLDPEQDIKIWGAYAQELQAMFENGDWRYLRHLPGTQSPKTATLPSGEWHYLKSQPGAQSRVPTEACSQMMVQIYGRHIPQIEWSLEEYPFSEALWQHYAWARAIAKKGSTRALLERLLPQPGWERYWPPNAAMGLLIDEEREKGNWDYLAEKLWTNWPDLRLYARNPADPAGGTWENIGMETEVERKGFGDAIWRDDLEPLIESLIKTNRVGDAETVILDMARLPALGDVRRRAVELAKAAGRGDLDRKWAAMKIPGAPSGPDMDALEAHLRAIVAGVPTVFMAGTREMPDSVWMNRAESDKVELEWPLNVQDLNPRLSELLFAREGWPKDGARWVLMDGDRAILASGPGAPTAEDILQALGSSGKEPPAKRLRRFVSEHPRHIEAKESLLAALELTAVNRASAMEASRRSPDEKYSVANTLAEEEDWAIWGDYATLYGQVLPLLMESHQPYGPGAVISYSSIHTSKAVNGVAHALLPQIEAQMRRRPMDEFLWDRWTKLSDVGGQSRFKGLRDSITLSPLDDPLGFPPEGPCLILTIRYLLKGSWQELIDLHEWRWEAIKGNLSGIGEASTPARFLLEAYLNLGKDHEAEAIVEVLHRLPEWKDGWFKDSVVELAKKLGKDTLAERWAKK